MREDDPATQGESVASNTDGLGELPSSRLGEAVDAVYGYAAGRYNWEDLIDFLAHLDHDCDAGIAGPGDLMSSLGMHLRRADELATRLHAGAAEPAYALLLLDGDRRVLAFNEEGRSHFAAIASGIEKDRRLTFRDHEHEAIFREAARGLQRTSSGAPAVLKFPDETGASALSCYIARGEALSPAMLRAAGFEHGDVTPFCALIAAPPEAGEEVLEVFRKALGLTPAEARLAARLRFGLSLKEAAEELGISVNTARNQLKSVFEKLGVNRQADLVRHLAELAVLAANMQAPSALRGTVTVAERRAIGLPDGRNIALRDLGKPGGFPVFILHPLVQSSLMRPQEARIAGECGVRLISIERPGIGLSSFDPGGSYASFAADLAHVADKLGIDRFALIGWASGAPYALSAASVLGGRVTRLALATPRLGFRSDLEATTPARRFFGGLRRHPWLFEAVFSIMRAKRSRRFFRPMIRNFLETSEPDRRLFESDVSLLDCVTDSLVEAIDVSHKGIVAELNLYSNDVPAETSGIVAPVLVWHGQEDEMNSVEDVRRMLADVPVSEFHVAKDHGHMVLFGRFREMLERLVNDRH